MSAAQIATVMVSALSAVVSISALLYARNRDHGKDSTELMRRIAADVMQPLVKTVDDNAHAVSDINQRVAPVLEVTTNKLEAISNRVGVLETKIDVFWKNVAYDAARILHSPHTPEFDALLDGFREGRLNTDDTVRFVEELAKIAGDRNQMNGDRLAAATIIRVIEQQGV